MAYLGNEPQKDTVINVKKYTAEEGQTTFNTVYQDYVNVTVNGLSIDEYTADDGMTVVLDSPLSAGDKVKIEGFSSLAYLNSYVKSETDTLLDAKADTAYVNDELSTVIKDTAHLFSGNGYQQLSNGLILQWGKFVSNVDTGQTVNFPIAFPSSCFSVVVNGSNGSISTIATATSFTYDRIDAIEGSPTFYYIAIGN